VNSHVPIYAYSSYFCVYFVNVFVYQLCGMCSVIRA